MRKKFIHDDKIITSAQDDSATASAQVGTWTESLQNDHSVFLLAILDEQRAASDMNRDLLAAFKEVADAIRQNTKVLEEIRDERRPHKTGRPLTGLAPANKKAPGLPTADVDWP